MKTLLPWLGALVIGVGLAFASVANGHAAPAQSLLPGLESITDGNITPISCRRYRHCHSRCVRRVWGVCRKRVRYCHRC
jgi:hypothetical protein